MALFFATCTSFLMMMNQASVGQQSARCNDYKECASNSLENSAEVDCNAVSGCSESIISIASSSGQIRCNGQTSCYHSHALSSEGSILCQAYKSCRYAQSIIAEGNIVCSGWSACDNEATTDHDATTNTNHQFVSYSQVQCSGTRSCAFNVIESEESTECTAAKSCYHATLHSGEDIVCGADKACAKSKLFASGTITASGKGAAYDAEITTDVFNAYGMYSAHSAVLSASEINAFGQYALSYATIDNEGISTLVLNAFGDMAGFGATVSCRGLGRVCNINCHASGCNGLTLMCLDSATCTISPKACNTPNDGTLSVDGVDCPMLRYQPLTESDSNVRGRRDEERQKEDIGLELERNSDGIETGQQALNDDIMDALLLADSVYDFAENHNHGAFQHIQANTILYSNIVSGCIASMLAMCLVRWYFRAKYTNQ